MIENAYPLGYTRLNPDTIVQVSLHSYLLLATEVIGGFFFFILPRYKKAQKPSKLVSGQ